MGRTNVGGTGSTSVTVQGSGLGVHGYTGAVRVGVTGCESTEWESETSVRCQAGEGGWGTRRVTVTAGERVGSVTS
eukprot:2821929-Rhodomonas_salina.1